MVHVMVVIEARPLLPYCAHVLTDVGDDLVNNYKPNTLKETQVGTLILFWVVLIFLPGTAGWRGSDSDSRSLGFWQQIHPLHHTLLGEG